MLIAKLVWNMTCSVVDIETEIYVEVPKGLAIKENKKLILRKTV
jgi:hypothetical protein